MELREQVLSERLELADTALADELLYMYKFKNKTDEFDVLDDCYCLICEIYDNVSDIMDDMDLYAKALRYCGRYEEALWWQRQLVTTQEKIDGKNNRWTIEAMKDLAILLNACGKREEALEMLKQAVTSATETLGNEHPLLEELNRVRDTILNE